MTERNPSPAASDASTWIAEDLSDYWTTTLPPSGQAVRLTRADLLADDAAVLRRTQAALVADGATRQAAATWLAGWFAGGAAIALAVTLARTGAGLLLDPAHVTWTVCPAGWPERLDIAQPAVLVPVGHPWQGTPRATVVADEAQAATGAVAALAGLAEPVVTACRGMAPVKDASLWDAVADALGCVFSGSTEVTQRQLDRLGLALDAPGAPWEHRPRLGWARSPTLGRLHVTQKGGCCLTFTCADPGLDPADLDPVSRAFAERFPCGPDTKRYCATCRFREPDDVRARQVFLAELWIDAEGKA